MAALAAPLAVRVVAGHRMTFAGLTLAVLVYVALPRVLEPLTRSIVAWDAGAMLLLAMAAWTFATEGSDAAIARNARRQQEGEWAVFAMTLAGIAFSFAALAHELSASKALASGDRSLRVTLVMVTLFVSWLVTHVLFALRYAHEYYARSAGGHGIDGGLAFPGTQPPDYWDFVYFALVLGMTFQVSDVDVTSRKLRRLAAVHGLLAFLFNTVIVALTVNIAASQL